MKNKNITNMLPSEVAKLAAETLPDLLMGDKAIEFKTDGQPNNHNPQIQAYKDLADLQRKVLTVGQHKAADYTHPHLNTHIEDSNG